MNLIEETSHVNLPQITPNEGTHLKVPRSIIEDLSVHFSLSEERTGHLRTTGRGREVRDISLVPVIFLIGGRVTDTVCVCVWMVSPPYRGEGDRYCVCVCMNGKSVCTCSTWKICVLSTNTECVCWLKHVSGWNKCTYTWNSCKCTHNFVDLKLVCKCMYMYTCVDLFTTCTYVYRGKNCSDLTLYGPYLVYVLENNIIISVWVSCVPAGFYR